MTMIPHAPALFDKTALRSRIRAHYLADESTVIPALIAEADLRPEARKKISADAAELIRLVRDEGKTSMMEMFLSEYGLTTKEGVALMCMAEALLRVPDKETIDELIEDKVCSGDWSAHLGHSDYGLINSSTWALLLTGKLIAPSDRAGISQTLRNMIKRLGEPVVRRAVSQAMKELGRQFVLGRTIEEATERAKKREKQGFTYSYDMLGEAARTEADAVRYHQAYATAIGKLSHACVHDDIRANPGISVKLSALHSRYEFTQRERVMDELVPRVLDLAQQAKAANMGFNIDAEEADRLDLSLDVIEAVLSDASLSGWNGFGVVVQAYGPRTRHVIDWLYALATQLDRKIMVRLVKGAYWDAEIKRAQVMGLDGFPVYTRKPSSDVSYICCAKRLLGMTDRIYPQFATHNAHSVSAILNLARPDTPFEFQRLHGMGESLHDAVVKRDGVRCRIYAPVGAHKDLLAYLVRRLLENGANSSFVNQIVDKRISPEQIARDPFEQVAAWGDNLSSPHIAKPVNLYGKGRRNARGWDITDPVQINALNEAREAFRPQQWTARPIIAGTAEGARIVPVINPADPRDNVGEVIEASAQDIEQAIVAAAADTSGWTSRSVSERAAVLENIADLFEQHAPELFALTTREAGKTLLDAIAEIREAVDFARYYAAEARRLGDNVQARGVITCISPWNFPLAIFSGPVLAALATGNRVLAKPAETTSLIAARAVELMHEAGVPADALQLLPGRGSEVGAALTGDVRIDGVCFTGSTLTAQRINRMMAEFAAPDAPLIAETGGLNAMIVDSTALPEQVVRDVLISSFQSAGQRCSALRMLYVQEDIADNLLEMLFGAMEELRIGNPWQLSTDVGPVIDAIAKARIEAHCEKFRTQGRLLKQLKVPGEGHFVAPCVIRLDGIEQLEEEIFGPVLHVATFKAFELDQVIDAINAKGFGLTFGLHSRIESRVADVTARVHAGNLYVNRNQIGAIVGSQPFGGEGLSGTGPKAGGPAYAARLTRSVFREQPLNEGMLFETAQIQQAISVLETADWQQRTDRSEAIRALLGVAELPKALDAELLNMPGPTGESNQLSHHPRGVFLCLGPSVEAAKQQAAAALAQGNAVVMLVPGVGDLSDYAKAAGVPLIGLDGCLTASQLVELTGFAGVCSQADQARLRSLRKALAARDGALLPLITTLEAERFVLERHRCIDTTAAGGNASLIAQSQ